jgi:predicted nuclease of predicted toxin-antitoxin system
MDEHVPKAITEGLRRRGVDVVTIQDLGLQSADDRHHLARAAQEQRVVVTQDADFLRLHASGMPPAALSLLLSRRRWPICCAC